MMGCCEYHAEQDQLLVEGVQGVLMVHYFMTMSPLRSPQSWLQWFRRSLLLLLQCRSAGGALQ